MYLSAWGKSASLSGTSLTLGSTPLPLPFPLSISPPSLSLSPLSPAIPIHPAPFSFLPHGRKTGPGTLFYTKDAFEGITNLAGPLIFNLEQDNGCLCCWRAVEMKEWVNSTVFEHSYVCMGVCVRERVSAYMHMVVCIFVCLCVCVYMFVSEWVT